MKTLVALIFLAVTGALFGDDQKTIRMLAKADEILAQTDVVSSCAVGYAGVCPEANWALSLIIAKHPDPISHLLELSERCQPAGFVMCLLGVRTLSQEQFGREFRKRQKEIVAANWQLETMIGCMGDESSSVEILTMKDAWTKEQILADPLPELWETVRLKPQLEALKKMANQMPEPTPSGVAHR
jgi:hypothetical protein